MNYAQLLPYLAWINITSPLSGNAAVPHPAFPDPVLATDTGLKHPSRPAVGRPAPPLHVAHWLNTATGNPMTFGDGHIYILDFTALWCGSCPATYPILHDLLARYGAARIRPIFVTQLWGLAEDHATLLRPAEELASFPAYFAKHHVTEPVAILDSLESGINAYSDDGSGNVALPKIVLIDGQGIVRDVMTGWEAGQTRTQLFRDVAQLLAAAAPVIPAKSVPPRDTVLVADTSPPLLTVDLLAHLKTFLDDYRKESPLVHDSGNVHRTSLHLQLPPEAAQVDLTVQNLGFPNHGTFPDMAVLAARFSSVAADVQRAGLSARQIPLLAGAVWSAYLVDMSDVAVRAAGVSWSPDTTTVLMRNVAFLRQHKPDVDALRLFPLSVTAAEDQSRQSSLDTGSDDATSDSTMVP